jgi:hypothetical protein
MFAATRDRGQSFDDLCVEIGRDPLTLRRSLLLSPPVRDIIYESVNAFTDVVGQYEDIGINEFILAYPRSAEKLPVFERIASDAHDDVSFSRSGWDHNFFV